MRAKSHCGEPRLTFFISGDYFSCVQKRSVHKGVIQPNFCILREYWCACHFLGFPRQDCMFVTARGYTVSLVSRAQNFYLVRKWIFQICRNFHIFPCLPLKWNMLKDSSGHPYSIYSIDRKQENRDQGSISGIRIIAKRWLSPLRHLWIFLSWVYPHTKIFEIFLMIFREMMLKFINLLRRYRITKCKRCSTKMDIHTDIHAKDY